MTGLSRCGRKYPDDDDSYKLASDGRYWPAGYLAGDDGSDPTCDGGWNDEP